MEKFFNFCVTQHNSFYKMKKYMPEFMANNNEANVILDINDVL